MSEVVTVSAGVAGTIYGTFAAAEAYLGARYGARYTAWLALADGPQKQTLISATDILNSQDWIETADTFAERDALDAFVSASYELAALIVEDEDLANVVDQGGNIQSANAGGAGVTFFAPTSARRGSAPLLPPLIMRLVGDYLAAAEALGADGGTGASGDDENPFSRCSDFDRGNPF